MRRSVIVLLALSALGCSYHVWSPPARVMPLEGIGALSSGEVRVQGAGHGHTSVEAFDPRPSPAGGALDLSVGLGEGVDVRATGQALYLAGGAQSDLDRGIWSGRAGLRWAPAPWIAMSGGVGAGAHAAGGFVAPDLGITLGYDDTVVGLFVDVRFGVSVPVDARTIELTQPGDEERHFATPAPTGILQLTPGLRIEALDRQDAGVGVVVRLTPSMSVLVDETHTSFWFGGGAAVEVAFGGPPPDIDDCPAARCGEPRIRPAR